MKITDFGVAVVESDSHLSKWVQEQRRLDVQDEFCQLFKQYIPTGGVVIDVGACIGDHTLSYAKMVGPSGTVFAFEPNKEAYSCLHHNMLPWKNVVRLWMALGAKNSTGESVPSRTEPENLGAVSILESEHGDIKIRALDDLCQFTPRIDFIKIDAEGSEPDIIAGAMQTLARLKPVLLVEINRPLLAERGKCANDIILPLVKLGYTVQPCEAHLSMEMEQVDVLCIPGP